MLSFSRLASFLLFVLSLSLLTCAAPTSMSNTLVAREGVRGKGDLVVAACIDLRAKAYTKAESIGELLEGSILVEVESLCKDIIAFSDVLVKVKTADVDAKVRAEIAAHLLVILKAIIKICAHLIAKLDLKVALELIAKVQVALKLVIDNLDICVSGFLEVFVKLNATSVAEADLRLMANVHLDVILNLFVSIRAKLGLKAVAGLAGAVSLLGLVDLSAICTCSPHEQVRLLKCCLGRADSSLRSSLAQNWLTDVSSTRFAFEDELHKPIQTVLVHY
ncbi:hypothetical protein AG1IA_07978 [Rhizoctonia solani AG-1 IA]|uniref:Transmembrane protein n=1 Tax=Thanatephorus cucumeris (strain AG1-IA) TaxID=983506 RepID=L8WMJ4_THACA|nr:hypothetical protein AG1IA_07978 [Rhizoctonia solani AG-1 IA]